MCSGCLALAGRNCNYGKGGAMNAFDLILWALRALYWTIRIIVLVMTGF
jgi:hypothetical protein